MLTPPFINQEWEDKIKNTLISRAKLIKNAEKDTLLQQCLRAKCKEDINFFFENFLFTIKNDTFFSDGMPNSIPFLLFPYQEELVSVIRGGITSRNNIFCEKSRQIGFTWVLLGVFLYGFLFHNHRYLIISRTADEVDKKGDINSCFERLRYMLSYIPKWLLPEGFDKNSGGENNKYMTISRPDGPGSITGESANANAGRGGTYTAIFMDEMAFMQDAPAINKACASATPCRVINSTPNGEGNEYYRMKKLAQSGGLKGLTIHWSLHPFYTPEWYSWKTSGMTDEQIAQELEINYNIAIEGRVYKKFAEKPIGDVDFSDVNYDYRLPLYVSIDNSHGGNDPHALIVFQMENDSGDIKIIDSLQVNCSITEMAFLLAKKPMGTMMMDDNVNNFYTRWMVYKRPIFIADPNDTDSTWNDTSIANEYKKAGIFLTVPPILRGLNGNIVEQIRITQQNLFRLKVNPTRCQDFISAIQNARYPKVKEGANRLTVNNKPIHDWTSHYRTALEYAMLFILNQEKETGYSAKKTRIVEVANPITGEIEYKEFTI